MLWLYIFAAIVAAIIVVLSLTKRQRHGGLTADEYFVIECFLRFNCFVWGVKRAGKDLFFMHVINLIGERHFANMPYSPLTEVRPLSDLCLGDNQFTDFMTGNIKKLYERKFVGGSHFYVSDIGIFCPSHENKELDNTFPSMPSYLALSSQIDGINVHMNSQAFGRPYIKLREQCGAWFQVLRTVDKGDCLVVHFISYTRERDAENDTRPEDLTREECKRRGIKARRFVVPKSSITYDTHYFRTLVYDIPQNYYANGVEKENVF